MKYLKTLIFLLLFLFPQLVVYSYPMRFVEDWYRCYTQRLQQDNTNFIENITFLEKALHSPFANPQWALVHINNSKQWILYQDLFLMHIYILLIQQHLSLAYRLDKDPIHFYDAPFKDIDQKSLQQAQQFYQYALSLWPNVIQWEKKAEKDQMYDPDWSNPSAQYWQDQAYQVKTGQLNLPIIIKEKLKQVEKNLTQLKKMSTSY